MQQSSAKNDDNVLAPDEISIKKTFQKFGESRKYLATKRAWLFVAVFIGAAFGFIYATLKKPVYTAECTFVLGENDKGAGSLGQYSALAAMAGVDVGESGGGLFQGDNILELYKSRLMIAKTLLSKSNFYGNSQSLIDRYLQFNEFRKAWEKSKLKNLNFDGPVTSYTLQHDSVINQIVKDINKNYLTVSKPDKKLSIVSVKVKATDELFAKAFTDVLVANVNSFYIQTKTKSALDNLRLLQRQTDSVRRLLNSSIAGTASATDYNPNPNPGMQVLRVPSQRRQVDVQANSAMYAEISKNLEIAKGVVERETPLIQVIDKPILPLDKDKVGRFKALLTGAFAGLFIAVTWLLIQRGYRKLMS